MPMVNRSNYAACPSCGKWMHKLAIADYLHNADDVVIGNLKGNRAHICQECYERADGQPMQADQNEEAKRKVAEQAKPMFVQGDDTKDFDLQNELREKVQETLSRVYEQREEICEAFLAKYCCQPDEIIQVEKKSEDGLRTEWYLTRRIDVKPVATPVTRATEDKRLDLPNDNELIDIFRKTRSRGFFNVLDELRFSLGLFIELRSKKS